MRGRGCLSQQFRPRFLFASKVRKAIAPIDAYLRHTNIAAAVGCQRLLPKWPYAPLDLLLPVRASIHENMMPKTMAKRNDVSQSIVLAP